MSFDSRDWIDDATETLDRSDFPYFLLIGLNETTSETFSERLYPASPGQDDEEAVIEAVRHHFAQMRGEKDFEA